MITAKAALMLAIVALGAAVIGWGSPGDKNSAFECTTTSCYPNPSFWAVNESFQASVGGICTTSAAYVDGNSPTLFVTITTPSSPPVQVQTAFAEFAIYDFDTHITVLGTTGKISIYDNDIGLGIALSREFTLSGFGANVKESASLQISNSVGPGQTDHYSLEIARTGGAGSICLDDWEGSGFALAVGGTPA